MNKRNRRVVLIEGDDSIDPDALSIFSDDIDIEFVYASREDDSSPEMLSLSVDVERVQRIADAIEMQRLLSSLKRIVRERTKQVERAIDRLEPDAEAAISALESLEREIADVRAKVRDTSQKETCVSPADKGRLRRSDDRGGNGQTGGAQGE